MTAKREKLTLAVEEDLLREKSIAPPALEEFDDLVRRAHCAVRMAGMKPADVRRAVAKARAER